jgi:hypothetical protein
MVSDVSGQPIGLIFKVQAIEDDGTDGLPRNISDRLPNFAALRSHKKEGRNCTAEEA